MGKKHFLKTKATNRKFYNDYMWKDDKKNMATLTEYSGESMKLINISF